MFFDVLKISSISEYDVLKNALLRPSLNDLIKVKNQRFSVSDDLIRLNSRPTIEKSIINERKVKRHFRRVYPGKP